MIDRIVTINDSTLPKGGATMLAVLASRRFRQLGHAVTFLAGDAGENADMAGDGIDIVALGETVAREASRASAFAKALYNAKAERMIADWIAAHDTPRTVYHLHNWGQILSPSIFRALSRVSKRLVISAHDFFHVCPNGSFSYLKTGELCGLTPMSASCILADCDRRNYGYKLWRVARQAVRNTTFDTRSEVPLLVLHDRMRPLLVRGGVPEAWVKTLPNPVTPFSATRIAAEDNDEFVFIGRMEHTKGPDIVARAARAAGVKMRFIGDGAMRQKLQRDFPEMSFDGFLGRDDIGARLRQARAVVMPSRYAEPYGLVAVEALWSGLPVLIADSAFLAPDIAAAGAGLAFRVTDEPGLSSLLATTLREGAATEAMSHAAYGRTRNLASTPEGWVEGLLTVFGQRLRGEPLS